MAEIQNTYHLILDIKRGMTAKTPIYRQGDNCSFTCLIYNNGLPFDVSDVLKIEVTTETSSGLVITKDGAVKFIDGQKGFEYVYSQDEFIDQGISKTTVTLVSANNRVSIQPFPVVVYGEDGGSDGFLDIIKALQSVLSGMSGVVNNAIPLTQKGQPNGVASLDSNGKIPVNQMPSEVEEAIKHVTKTVWSNQVHGMRITRPGQVPNVDAGIIQYESQPNNWQNIGFAPDATGGGGSGSQFLDVNLSKSNGVVTFTYVGVPTLQSAKWAKGDRDKTYFSTNGTVFNGLTLPVSDMGLYTLYYVDSNGINYIRLFNIEQSDLAPANATITISNGYVTAVISQPTQLTKWDNGLRSVNYFATNGNVYTGNTFQVASVGNYTLYYKTNNGAEYVQTFEVKYQDLVSELPVVVYGDIMNSGSDKKYRSFNIGLKNPNVAMVKFTGRYTGIGSTDYDSVYGQNGYYFSNGTSGYVDVSSNSHDMTVEFLDNNYTVLMTAVHKCRSQYNYLVVDNKYVSLTRIKNTTSNYTLPTIIEGLPVLDAGCALFTNDTSSPSYDNWNTTNLTIPSQYMCGGMAASYTRYSNSTISTIRVESSNFVFNIGTTSLGFNQNNTSGITVYVPAGSATETTITNRVTNKTVVTF